jgi:hypothetical protein
MATQTVTELSDAQLSKLYGATEAPKANGPALAAILAAGIGCAVLGVVTTIATANADFRTSLALYKPAGPLSGKIAVEVIAYLASWAIAAFAMRGKTYNAAPFFVATFVLIAIGVLGTFPIFFDLFAPK